MVCHRLREEVVQGRLLGRERNVFVVVLFGVRGKQAGVVGRYELFFFGEEQRIEFGDRREEVTSVSPWVAVTDGGDLRRRYLCVVPVPGIQALE
jgi:hypothetical protein